MTPVLVNNPPTPQLKPAPPTNPPIVESSFLRQLMTLYDPPPAVVWTNRQMTNSHPPVFAAITPLPWNSDLYLHVGIFSSLYTAVFQTDGFIPGKHVFLFCGNNERSWKLHMEVILAMKVQELRDRVEELSEQNQTVLNEIDQLKKLIREGLSQQGDKGQSNPQSSSQRGGGASGGQQQSAAPKGSSSGSGQVSNLANELMQIKDMITHLETKTSQYVSNQSGGSLKEQDVVNLVLTLMDGMIDWTADFVQNNSQSNASGNSPSG